MWIAKRDVLTKAGWVSAGRVVEDGDPMLEGVEDAFEKVVRGGAGKVETTAAEPGKVRTVIRTKSKGA